MELFQFSLRCKEREWRCEQAVSQPFNELILSWNGFRPAAGYWRFYISLYQTQWSTWLKYAEWGASRQKTFHSAPEDSFAKTYQDVVTSTQGFCFAFRILIEASERADLTELHHLIICCSKTASIQARRSSFVQVALADIPGQSQMLLSHPRRRDFCSPTSTATAINYLLQKKQIDPIAFAEVVRDEQFDIYGNWVLNTAAAYEALQGRYRTFVVRLNSFSDALSQIAKGLPVVVSVKGPLAGSPQPYAQGHLMLLTGFDSSRNRVLCMDPGFATDDETRASYPLDSFLEAWQRRRNLAYLFEPTP